MSPRRHLVRCRVEKLGLSKAAAAARIGVHPKTLARWETGKIGSIRLHELRRLAEAYGLPFAALRAAEESRGSGRSESGGEGVVDAELVGLRSAGDLLELAGEPASMPPGPSAALRSRRVDGVLVDQVETLVFRLRRLDDEVGGTDLLPIARDRRRRIAGLLAGSYTDAVGRRLLACAADVGQLAGWLAYDSGQHGLSQRYWVAALRAARLAGDHALGAYVLAGLALQASELGSAADGLVLLGVAERELGAGGPPRVAALLAARRAVAAAGLGQRAECESSLGQAETLLASGGTAPAWIYYFGHGDALLHAGTCWLALGEPARAERAFLDALDALDPGYVRDRVVAHTRVAASRVAQREIEGAAAAAATAVQLAASHLSSVRVGDELAGLDRALRPFRAAVPAAAELHGQFEALGM